MEVIEKILGKLTRLRHLAIVKLGILLGISMEELLGIKFGDVEWINGKSKTIAIRRRVVYLGIDGKFDFHIVDEEEEKKIIIPKKAVDIVNWLKRNEQVNRAKSPRSYSADYDGFICVNKWGKLYAPCYLKRYYTLLARRTWREINSFNHQRI